MNGVIHANGGGTAGAATGTTGQAIDLAGVEKGWGDKPAVDGIDLAMPAGGFTALLGPSGCGKSTTLRIIAGLETVDRGTITIGGRDVTHLPPAARDLAMVFQSYALFPHLSVAENIAFGLEVRRTPAPERQKRLAEVADLLGLSALLDRKPAQLSGGQQQRVALGRAIISRRPVCLMDEPLSNLDARLRHHMRSEIRALQRGLGFTMVYVTHDQVEAVTMADQVALMNQGRIEQVASPREIYARPATVFAARFIGVPPMNLFTPLAFGERAGRLAEERLLIGARPEDLVIDPAGPLSATVADVEFQGGETLVDCRVAGPDGSSDSVVVKAAGAFQAEKGSPVRLSLPPSLLHVFDATSERRRSDGVEAIAATLLGSGDAGSQETG